jgi:hypothetical protein
MKIKLRPLSELTGDNYTRRVLMVRYHKASGCVRTAYMGTMAGEHCITASAPDGYPLPDGWCEPIEIEVDDDAANG